MRNVFLALLWVFADAAGPPRYGDQSGFSGGRVSSRSTEVEEYLGSMTKIKPQWSDEKILRSARSIYGEGWVPRRIPEHVRHVPGTVSSRPGSSVHRVEGMSSEEKRQEVYRIRDRNPRANLDAIASEFSAMYPTEPNPPDRFTVHNYLFYKKVNERLALLPSGNSWARLGNLESTRLSREGKRMLTERMAARGNRDRWEDIVFDVVVQFYHSYNMKLKPGTVYKWYRNQRGLGGPPDSTRSN